MEIWQIIVGFVGVAGFYLEYMAFRRDQRKDAQEEVKNAQEEVRRCEAEQIAAEKDYEERKQIHGNGVRSRLDTMLQAALGLSGAASSPDDFRNTAEVDNWKIQLQRLPDEEAPTEGNPANFGRMRGYDETTFDAMKALGASRDQAYAAYCTRSRVKGPDVLSRMWHLDKLVREQWADAYDRKNRTLK